MTTVRQATAWHEAGHAVIGLALGLEVAHARIRPDDDSAGNTPINTLADLPIEDKIALCVAGIEAMPDDAPVHDLAFMHDVGECLAEILDDVPKSQREQVELGGQHRARELLAQHRRALEVIAAAIDEQGHVPKADLERLFRS
jgi:hypothetical protein